VRQPDISLARSELGWEPQVSVQHGLRRTISWFRGHQDLVLPGSPDERASRAAEQERGEAAAPVGMKR